MLHRVRFCQVYREALSELWGAEHMPSTAQAHFSACAPPLYSPFSVLRPWGGAGRVAAVGSGGCFWLGLRRVRGQLRADPGGVYPGGTHAVGSMFVGGGCVW